MKCRHLCPLLALILAAAGTLRAQEPEAIDHYRAGYELLKSRNYRNAAIELEQAVVIDSTYGTAFYALGQAYKVLNEYANAIGAFERARELGFLAERIGPELAQLYHKQAIILYQQRKYREAIANFDKSLNHDPRNAKAVYAMGLCYNGLREPETAQQAFERSIQIDPEYAKPYKALGDIRYRNREYGPAADSYRQAIGVDSTYMDAYSGLAQVMIDTKNLEETAALMNEAVRLDPQYAEGYLFMGTALNRLGRQHEAIDPLRRAIELEPANAEAYYRLGEAYYGKGDYRKAVETGQQAVQHRRNFHAAEVLLGDANVKLNQVQEARGWYSKAMQDSRFRDYCKHQLEELDRPVPSGQ